MKSHIVRFIYLIAKVQKQRFSVQCFWPPGKQLIGGITILGLKAFKDSVIFIGKSQPVSVCFSSRLGSAARNGMRRVRQRHKQLLNYKQEKPGLCDNSSLMTSLTSVLFKKNNNKKTHLILNEGACKNKQNPKILHRAFVVQCIDCVFCFLYFFFFVHVSVMCFLQHVVRLECLKRETQAQLKTRVDFVERSTVTMTTT